jgi:hypothetical protein
MGAAVAAEPASVVDTGERVAAEGAVSRVAVPPLGPSFVALIVALCV